MKTFLTIGITILIIIIGGILIYNFMPLSWVEFNDLQIDQQFGGTSTLTTILGTDTLKDSREVINTNFRKLNEDKIEVSTTTLPLITTLAGLTTAGSLSSVGTITSGIWNGTDIAVTAGGTGWSYFASYTVLLGNAGNAIATTTTPIEGQFLTGHVGSVPTWTTPSVNTAAAYFWTGTHIFTASSTMYKLELTNNGTATSTLDKTRWDTLSSGATSDATSLHYHSGVCVGGAGYQNDGVAVAQVISHGLGVAPTFISIDATANNNNTYVLYSFGLATSTSANKAFGSSQIAGLVGNRYSTSSIIYMISTDGVTVSANAAISAISATTFTLNWTVNTASTGTKFYRWQACK